MRGIWLFVAAVLPLGAQTTTLRTVRESTDPSQASVVIHAKAPVDHAIPKAITGKFAEHLGFNIYNGMDAQILRSPTFADYPFWNGQMSPDGVTEFQTDAHKIDDELRHQATRFGWPASELNGLVQARADALACFWTRVGSRDDVQVSPDTGPFGGRAQRVQITAAGQGVAQWTWLPLHRQRRYEVELMVRSADVNGVTVSFSGKDVGQPVASLAIKGISKEWRTLKGTLTLPADLPAESAYRFSIVANAPGQFVLRHAFLRPGDHMSGADPDVVAWLRQAHLPLLRWPGGNFASTYHWEDGIGPIERRPTRPNYAWGAIEPNTFGTDEFIAFCRAVGCEPMICINAGSGTPEEAARWIEYCNGPATSPMGRLRAENGHAEPYHVTRWEVGNELWGRWQMDWTTASGYVDRFKAFTPAMLRADPTIALFSCGAPAMSGKTWNDTLIAGLGRSLGTITDHPLVGGNVPPATDPLDVYRDFMAVPEVLQQKWTALRDAMAQGGIQEPRLAVTELQLFAHIAGSSDKDAPVRLTHENMPSQGSISEAIYDVLIYHAAIRLQPFVDLITHSAVINHGGGLRKERERVWANPCQYAQAAFAEFAEAKPVSLEIECAQESAPMVLPDLKNATRSVSFGAIDALAAVATDGAMLVSLVNRSSAGPVRVTITAEDFPAAPTAQLHSLTGRNPWDGNSLEKPELVKPAETEVSVQDGKVQVSLPPYTVARLRMPKGR
jgi:alpha-N-arabinofuranosidase